MLAAVALRALLLSAPLALATALSANRSSWAPVAIGGGGYVMQVHVHPVTPHVYMRTDVGGVYRRYAPAGGSPQFAWAPLLDWAPPEQSSLYSTNALAMDPVDGAILYVLTGPYYAYSNCSILVSRDAGATWTVTRAAEGWGLRCGGNEHGRAVGDRLAVHPTQRETIAVGGSDGRVYVTSDGFASGAPTRVILPAPASASACNPDKDETCVVLSVVWLTVGDATLLLAAVPSLGFFASAGPDYTTGWSFVAGSDAPSHVNRFATTRVPGRLWASANSGGVWTGDVAPRAGGWAVTWRAPSLAVEGVPFSGIAVRGAAGEDVVAISLLYDSNTTLFRSLDGGDTWSKLAWSVTSAVPWWGAFSLALNAASSIAWEEGSGSDTPLLWASDFFGSYAAAAPPGATTLAFSNVETGHEEVCVNFIRAPLVGDVLSGAADVGGWRHDGGVSTWPSKTFAAADGWAHNCAFGAALTLSLSPDNSSVDTLYVSAGDEYGSCHGSPSWCGLHSWVGVSRDGGRTFEDTTWDDAYAVDGANPYRVMVHPFDGSKAVVAARTGLPVTYTRDYGKTWAAAVGPPGLTSVGQPGNFWYALPLAREEHIPVGLPEATFYYYNGTTSLFRSDDSGSTWSSVFDKFPAWQVPFFGIATPPRGTSAEGDIWAFAGWKLWHSIDAGVTFSQVWELYNIEHVFTIGALPATTSPSGRDASALSALCAAKGAATAAAATPARLPLPIRSGAAYVVYAIATRDYNTSIALYASIDQGHSWLPLSGVNATEGDAGGVQALGDSPYVLEASAREVGTVFVGTGGRGAFWRDCAAELREALLACEGAAA